MGVYHRLFGSRKWAVFLTVFSNIYLVPVMGAEEEDAGSVPALIMRVEGDGIAKVRKAIGTEEVAGANGKLFPGDRVITDEKSTVFLMINDGSVIKVGLSSEFKVEQAKMHERFMSWAFGLLKGSMRALVEKNANPDVRFRVNTPSGTIGVRGTEFVVALDEDAKTSYLYTIEGLVSYGGSSCEKNNSCMDVRGGEASSLKLGDSRPAKPQPFHARDMFGLSASTKPAVVDNRMSLFRDAKRVTSRYMQETDEVALKKLLGEASEALAMSQDQALGRTKEERTAMHEAIKNGSWADTISAANAYAGQNRIMNAGENGGAEDLVGQTAVAKFRLGLAVKEAVSSGLFGNARAMAKDPKVSWGAVDLTKMRKNVEYEQAEKAKGVREKLAAEAEDYSKVLELAEARHAKEPEEIRGDDAAPAKEEGPAAPCDLSCRTKRVSQEVNAMSEGIVTAFNENPGNSGSQGHLSKKEKGVVKSRHFKKAVPGNACYNEVRDCKLVTCKGMSYGKKCKKGENVKVCSTKKTHVRCKDKD